MEREPIDSQSLDIYFQLGEITAHSGMPPSEAIQKIIKSDPEKEAAFMMGASEGNRLKFEEEIPASNK